MRSRWGFAEGALYLAAYRDFWEVVELSYNLHLCSFQFHPVMSLQVIPHPSDISAGDRQPLQPPD